MELDAGAGRLELVDGMAAGRVIDGRYEVTSASTLGAGASGSVYRGIVQETATPIAIKVIDRADVEDSPAKVRQMERELQITMKLKHASSSVHTGVKPLSCAARVRRLHQR